MVLLGTPEEQTTPCAPGSAGVPGVYKIMESAEGSFCDVNHTSGQGGECPAAAGARFSKLRYVPVRRARQLATSAIA